MLIIGPPSEIRAWSATSPSNQLLQKNLTTLLAHGPVSLTSRGSLASSYLSSGEARVEGCSTVQQLFLEGVGVAMSDCDSIPTNDSIAGTRQYLKSSGIQFLPLLACKSALILVWT